MHMHWSKVCTSLFPKIFPDKEIMQPVTHFPIVQIRNRKKKLTKRTWGSYFYWTKNNRTQSQYFLTISSEDSVPSKYRNKIHLSWTKSTYRDMQPWDCLIRLHWRHGELERSRQERKEQPHCRISTPRGSRPSASAATGAAAAAAGRRSSLSTSTPTLPYFTATLRSKPQTADKHTSKRTLLFTLQNKQMQIQRISIKQRAFQRQWSAKSHLSRHKISDLTPRYRDHALFWMRNNRAKLTLPSTETLAESKITLTLTLTNNALNQSPFDVYTARVSESRAVLAGTTRHSLDVNKNQERNQNPRREKIVCTRDKLFSLYLSSREERETLCCNFKLLSFTCKRKKANKRVLWWNGNGKFA